MTRSSKFDSVTTGYTQKEISTVPPVKSAIRFLGSPAIYSGGFKSEGVLSKGPGEIIGNALVKGKPLAGLKIRLALNGTVNSQWATTNTAGQCIINVPYGKYALDGFEIDQSVANKLLANKIDHPGFHIQAATLKYQPIQKGLASVSNLLTQSSRTLKKENIRHPKK